MYSFSLKVSMKAKTFFTICTLFILLKSYASGPPMSNEIKYRQFGLVWGLLKYHHPDISNGSYDWDSEFIKGFDKIKTIADQDDMNTFLHDYILSFKLERLAEKKADDEKLFDRNSDYQWIENGSFDPKLQKLLIRLKDNKNINSFYASTDRVSRMLSFSNEKGFPTFDSNIESHRLLLLFNFWNAIQYWNVNKYLMEKKWEDMLVVLIPEFINAGMQLDFEIAKSKLIASLNDSHSFYLSPLLHDSLFKYKPVFACKTINDSLLVAAVFNKTLASADNIEVGDVITKIRNEDIATAIKARLSPILSASNVSFLKKWGGWLLYNKDNSLNIDVLKADGTRKNQDIHLYETYQDENATYLHHAPSKNWSFAKPTIGYINLSNISKNELKAAFKKFDATKGIIIDLRNYPQQISSNDIAKYVYDERKEFIKVLMPLKGQPSFSKYDSEAPLGKIVDPFKAGGKNKDFYKGKIILLVNNRTQSKGEYIGMTIQQAPNCITIGEQTAGSVMNITEYMMSDKTQISFTSMGAFYPDGQGVQGKGLKIDHELKERAIGYDSELYIKEAIKLIEN